MSFATTDLREEILTIFAEQQEPWQREVCAEMVRILGFQGLRETVQKAAWAAANKDKQREYSRRYVTNMSPEQRERRLQLNAAYKKAHPTIRSAEAKAKRNARERAARAAQCKSNQ